MTAENQMDIKINAKANANFDHLLKAMPKGFAMLCKLCFGKREANITRYQMLTAAQTEKEYQQILLGECVFEDGRLVPVQNPILPERLNPMQTEIEQESKNLAGNLQIAAEALKDIPDEQISDKEVDDDFFARWRREAKVIGNEELQRLWGRLLAEEIKEPDTIPFRTLDVLKNITPPEALLFQAIAPYVNESGYFVCNPMQLPANIGLIDLMILREAGLISSLDKNIHLVSASRVRFDCKEHPATMFKNLAFVSCKSEEPLKFPGFVLSLSGKIALKICDYDHPDAEQTKYICKVIAGGGARRITVHKVQAQGSVSRQPMYDSAES